MNDVVLGGSGRNGAPFMVSGGDGAKELWYWPAASTVEDRLFASTPTPLLDESAGAGDTTLSLALWEWTNETILAVGCNENHVTLLRGFNSRESSTSRHQSTALSSWVISLAWALPFTGDTGTLCAGTANTTGEIALLR